jgi:hypothetical protein
MRPARDGFYPPVADSRPIPVWFGRLGVVSAAHLRHGSGHSPAGCKYCRYRVGAPFGESWAIRGKLGCIASSWKLGRSPRWKLGGGRAITGWPVHVHIHVVVVLILILILIGVSSVGICANAAGTLSGGTNAHGPSVDEALYHRPAVRTK